MATTYDEGLQTFLAEAAEAYQRMFATEEQGELRTFSQREVRVYEEGRRLSRWLLAQHLEHGKESQPAAETWPCPHCRRPSARVDDEGEARPMTTLVGDITFARAKYKCGHCRKSFFPSGPQLGAAELSAQPRSAQTCR